MISLITKLNTSISLLHSFFLARFRVCFEFSPKIFFFPCRLDICRWTTLRKLMKNFSCLSLIANSGAFFDSAKATFGSDGDEWKFQPTVSVIRLSIALVIDNWWFVLSVSEWCMKLCVWYADFYAKRRNFAFISYIIQIELILQAIFTLLEWDDSLPLDAGYFRSRQRQIASMLRNVFNAECCSAFLSLEKYLRLSSDKFSYSIQHKSQKGRVRQVASAFSSTLREVLEKDVQARPSYGDDFWYEPSTIHRHERF